MRKPDLTLNNSKNSLNSTQPISSYHDSCFTANDLENQVGSLCEFDRRSLHTLGTKKTLDYLSYTLSSFGYQSGIFSSKPIKSEFITLCVEDFLENALPRKDASLIEERILDLDLDSDFQVNNLVARLGNAAGKKIIVAAHYDTDILVSQGAGADDNASGVAVLLMLAKKLKMHEQLFKDAGLQIQFCFFWFRGSTILCYWK